MTITTQTLQPVTQPSGIYPVLVTKTKKKEKTLPLPIPNPNESQSDFINRAMGSDVMQTEYKDKKQRLAVAYSQWRRSKKEDNMSSKNESSGDKAKVFVAPKTNAGPNYPDKGTDHIWSNPNIQQVSLYEVPGLTNDFKKACHEIEEVMKRALEKC